MNAAFIENDLKEIVDLVGKCSFDNTYSLDQCVESNVV